VSRKVGAIHSAVRQLDIIIVESARLGGFRQYVAPEFIG